jgi:prevent-host-death family protein
MATEISATDAVRRFSELLNAVRYRNDSFTVIRGGKPAAAIIPVEPATMGKTLRELNTIVEKLPHLNDDSEIFAGDVDKAACVQPSVPEKPVWE